jgi:hypothetical protein
LLAAPYERKASLGFSSKVPGGVHPAACMVPPQAAIVPDPLDIRTEDKEDAHQECSRDQFCNYGCDQQWPWEKFGCELAKETCKDTQKLDCERRRTMAQAISAKKIATVSFKEVSVYG